MSAPVVCFLFHSSFYSRSIHTKWHLLTAFIFVRKEEIKKGRLEEVAELMHTEVATALVRPDIEVTQQKQLTATTLN